MVSYTESKNELALSGNVDAVNVLAFLLSP